MAEQHIDATPTLKQCGRCGAPKPIGDFSPDRKRIDGLKNWCKPCRAAHARMRREMHGDHIRALQNAGRIANLQRRIEIERRAGRKRWATKRVELLARARAWGKANREKTAACNGLKRARRAKALPAWLSEGQMDAMAKLYARAVRTTRDTGEQHDVDHIVPLRAKDVSGLHVPWNLRIVTRPVNQRKGNRLDHALAVAP